MRGGSGPLALSEGVNRPGVAEQAVQVVPIEAQSAAVARATASICNEEWGRLGGMSGHVGFVHTLSEGVDENNISRHTLA